MKISRKKIIRQPSPSLKNSGPPISLTNRCPQPLQSQMLNTPPLPNSPELWNPFEYNEIEKMCVQKLEELKKVKNGLEQSIAGAKVCVSCSHNLPREINLSIPKKRLLPPPFLPLSSDLHCLNLTLIHSIQTKPAEP